MIDLDRTVRILHAKREELLNQLDAVDRALAALTGAGITVANTQELNTKEAAEEATSRVVPTWVKPPTATQLPRLVKRQKTLVSEPMRTRR